MLQTVFKSPQMTKLVELACIAAKSSAPAFITGENGVGKEHIARILHDDGPRTDKPFIAVNCAAFPRELFESELFGSKKGAYTGSVSDRKGLFRDAEDGTIFLDEISEMPLDMQSKLLRVLQDGKVRGVGDHTFYPIECRVIAATNRSINDALRQGKIRMDLYYRLAVIKFHMPALRERKEDIAALSEHFFQQYSTQEKKEVTVDEDVLPLLMSVKWEGNVRQLQNAIHRSVIFCLNGKVTAHDFANEVIETVEPSIFKETEALAEGCESLSLDDVIKRTVAAALQRNHWNKQSAAKEMGIGRQTLYNYLGKYQLSRPMDTQTVI